MVRYSNSIIVPFARERVFALLSDWSNLAHWDMNISKAVANPPTAPPALGTMYDCAFNLNGRSLDVDYECISFDSPNHAKFLGLASLFRSEDSITCEMVDNNQTKVTAEFNLTFRGLLSPFSFALSGPMQKTGPLVMKDLDKFVREKLSE